MKACNFIFKLVSCYQWVEQDLLLRSLVDIGNLQAEPLKLVFLDLLFLCDSLCMIDLLFLWLIIREFSVILVILDWCLNWSRNNRYTGDLMSWFVVSFGGILVLRMWWVMPSDRIKAKKFRLQHKRKFVWPNLMEIKPHHWWKACVLRVIYIRSHGMLWYHNEIWIVTEFHNSKGTVSHNIY